MDSMRYTYNAEDIFQEIPDDPDNIILKFPEELLKEAGWQEGDTLNIQVENGVITVTKIDG